MSNRESALAAIRDAREEAQRPAPRPLVLAALLADAEEKVQAIQELKQPRRERKPKAESA